MSVRFARNRGPDKDSGGVNNVGATEKLRPSRLEQVILPTFIECSCEFSLLEDAWTTLVKEKKKGMAGRGNITYGFG